MGSECLLGKLQSLLSILDTTGLEELDDSLLIGGDSANLSNDLSNELYSLS
jgi:hypothetical protein